MTEQRSQGAAKSWEGEESDLITNPWRRLKNTKEGPKTAGGRNKGRQADQGTMWSSMHALGRAVGE